MLRVVKKVIFLLIILCTVFTYKNVNVFAAEITVCSTGCNYSNLNEAVTSSVSGDKIFIKNGTYEVDQLTTGEKNLTIEGESKDGAIIIPSSSFSVDNNSYKYLFNASNINANITINNLTIDGKKDNTRYITAVAIYGKGSLSNVKITNCSDTGIYSTGFLALNNVEISNIGQAGIYFGSILAEGTIKNSKIIDIEEYGVLSKGSIIVEDTEINGSSVGIYASGTETNSILKNVKIFNSQLYGIYSEGNFEMDGSEINTIGAIGIYLFTEDKKGTIKNLKLSNCTSSGIYSNGILSMNNVQIINHGIGATEDKIKSGIVINGRTATISNVDIGISHQYTSGITISKNKKVENVILEKVAVTGGLYGLMVDDKDESIGLTEISIIDCDFNSNDTSLFFGKNSVKGTILNTLVNKVEINDGLNVEIKYDEITDDKVNNPQTGDVLIYACAILLTLSLIIIVFIYKKKIKNNKI